MMKTVRHAKCAFSHPPQNKPKPMPMDAAALKAPKAAPRCRRGNKSAIYRMRRRIVAGLSDRDAHAGRRKLCIRTGKPAQHGHRAPDP